MQNAKVMDLNKTQKIVGNASFFVVIVGMVLFFILTSVGVFVNAWRFAGVVVIWGVALFFVVVGLVQWLNTVLLWFGWLLVCIGIVLVCMQVLGARYGLNGNLLATLFVVCPLMASLLTLPFSVSRGLHSKFVGFCLGLALIVYFLGSIVWLCICASLLFAVLYPLLIVHLKRKTTKADKIV